LTACSVDTIRKVVRFSAACFLFCSLARAAPIDDAFRCLYNFDFPAAHRVLDNYIAANPKDPLGYSTRAAAYLFHELDRLNILAAEFFTDDKKITANKRLEPDPVVREKFFFAIETAQQLANERLLGHPGDANALFSLCLAEGMITDYMAFVEKKRLRSLGPAQRSHRHALELLRLHPDFADAYLTTGLNEYLVGSLPFFIRWFVRFDGVEGNKLTAVSKLEKVAREGRYLGPFARILLSLLHLREKRPHITIRLLEELIAEFPHNPLLRYELDKIRAKFPPPAIRR